ncbi:MAG TPA: hypothetical protein EYN59_01790 [Candidatus Marinimicrobia bacterium]|nr:hypothetical protein [Candidatus Neomarinimicrobiota bacterium]
MRHLIICVMMLFATLFAQEEADTTFMEEDDLMMEETEEDTTEISDEAVPAASEGLVVGYKGLAWGATIDQLQGPAEDAAAGGTKSKQRLRESQRKTVEGLSMI